MRKGLKDEGEHFENNIFNYSDYDVEKIDEFLEENNIYIVAKIHFEDNKLYKQDDFKLPKRLIFLNTEIMNEHLCTIYHIMDAFDGLITDYSSIYVDYLLLNKPIIFSCPDIEKCKEDRGFIVDDPTLLMPGAIVKTQAQLLKNLSLIIENHDTYKDKRKEMMPFFHNHLDGNSSKRLLEEILKIENISDSGKLVGQLFQKNISPLDQYITNELIAEIFFDEGNGFNEKNKLSKKYLLDQNNNNNTFTLELDVDKNIKMIRFDPDDIGRITIDRFEISLGVDKINNYTIIGGKKYNNKIIFSTIDPQILIPINVESKQKLTIYFNYDDLYVNGGELLEDTINDSESKDREIKSLKDELQMVYNSKSWKMTKWYRRLRDLIKN